MLMPQNEPINQISPLNEKHLKQGLTGSHSLFISPRVQSQQLLKATKCRPFRWICNFAEKIMNKVSSFLLYSFMWCSYTPITRKKWATRHNSLYTNNIIVVIITQIYDGWNSIFVVLIIFWHSNNMNPQYSFIIHCPCNFSLLV